MGKEINRDIWKLAAPIILSNVSVPLLGAVDTAVVGHLPGAHHIGAVAIGALILSFIYWGFGFLRMGTTGFTAQSLGAGDRDETLAVLARAMLAGGVLSISVLALQWPLSVFAFTLIEPSHLVEEQARIYFDIRIWGAPATLANYALVGWFIGLRDAKAAFYVQIFMNGLNIILDLWFVVGLEWGVAGVAWASLISEGLAIGLAFWLAARKLHFLNGVWSKDRILDGAKLRRMFAVNRDIFIRTLGLQISFALFTAVSARMGDTILAVNAVLMNFQSIMAYALDGFAHAIEALAGSYLGARDRNGFRKAVKISTLWALLFAVIFTLAYALFGGLIIDLMTDMEDIRSISREYLPWVIALPLISVWSFQLDGIFIGTTRTAEMRNAMVQSAIIFLLAIVILQPMYANHGLWMAMMVLMVARAITLAIRYPALEKTV